jgi:hypothetical protein
MMREQGGRLVGHVMSRRVPMRVPGITRQGGQCVPDGVKIGTAVGC